MKLKSFFSTLALSAMASSQVFAAGYSTGIYSTSGLATSYAGSATGIHDGSDIFFNPANSADAKHSEFIASITHLKLDITSNHANSTAGGKQVHDAGVDSQIPEFFLVHPINEKIAFGLAVTSPFGLASKYDSAWVGRYQAIESSVTTININPSLSYKINNDFSVGAGFQAQYYKALLTQAVFTGGNDAFGKLSGDSWGYGFNLGAKYKFSDQLKFGIGYRSKIDHKISGTTKVADLGLYSDFTAKTTTPESATAGLAFKPTSRLELAYDMTWTRWSRLKSLGVNAHQNPALNTQTTFNWHDSFLYSLGGNFTLNDKWLLRAGAAYEKDATSNSSREPRIPTGDRIWLSGGFNYKINKRWEMDFAYVHQFFQTTKVSLPASANNLNVRYTTRVDVFSIAAKMNF